MHSRVQSIPTLTINVGLWYGSSVAWSTDEAAATRKAHRDAGLCVYCTNYAEIGDVCGNHWFVRLSKRLLGKSTRENGMRLKATFVASKARCAYTDVELTFKTAAAVHRVPVSRGGARSAENIEWVCNDVARMKGELLPEEFRTLCAAVISPAHQRDGG